MSVTDRCSKNLSRLLLITLALSVSTISKSGELKSECEKDFSGEAGNTQNTPPAPSKFEFQRPRVPSLEEIRTRAQAPEIVEKADYNVVRRIVQNRCRSCHDHRDDFGSEGAILGGLFKKSNPEDTDLMSSIVNGSMPESGHIPLDEVATIYRWLQDEIKGLPDAPPVDHTLDTVKDAVIWDFMKNKGTLAENEKIAPANLVGESAENFQSWDKMGENPQAFKMNVPNIGDYFVIILPKQWVNLYYSNGKFIVQGRPNPTIGIMWRENP